MPAFQNQPPMTDYNKGFAKGHAKGFNDKSLKVKRVINDNQSVIDKARAGVFTDLADLGDTIDKLLTIINHIKNTP